MLGAEGVQQPLVQLEVRREPICAGLLVGDRAVISEITKSAGRNADVANRLTDPLHEIANCGGVRDDAGPAILQRNRTTFENVDVPSLVSENQRCRETPEGSARHECPAHRQVPLSRTLEHVPACAAPTTCSVSRSLLATGNPPRPAPRGAGVPVAEGSVAAIAPRIAYIAPAVIGADPSSWLVPVRLPAWPGLWPVFLGAALHR